MIVQVYKNLHKSRAAGKNIYSVRDKKSGLVISHVKEIVLKNVIFKVSEAGRQRVLREKKKNVHSWAEGKICKNHFFLGCKIYYNPYKVDQFTDLSTGEKVHNCKFARINEDGVFAKDINKKNK